MDGEFRAGLLNHATFDEIQDGRRKFVECTWVKGYTPDSIRVLLTGWYEVNNAGLCPVDSLGMDGGYGILNNQQHTQ